MKKPAQDSDEIKIVVRGQTYIARPEGQQYQALLEEISISFPEG